MTYLIFNNFIHLKTKSHYSILESSIKVDELINKAVIEDMAAIALTDSYNLFGAMEFTKKAIENKIKPIIGCEFYVCDDHKDKTRRDDGFQIVFLAKNKLGYYNLSKMS